MEEIWKTVPEYPLYEASSAGRIRRIAGYQAQKPRMRKLQFNPVTRYYEIFMCKDGQKRMFRAHRIIASAFFDGIEGKQVNHKNGNRLDNRIENLELVTCSENHLHSYRELRRFRPTTDHIVRDPSNGRILKVLKKNAVNSPSH